MSRSTTVYTIGHSTRPIEDFVALLKEHAIELVADVRTAPGSRRHPQFGAESLRASLAREGIGYRHLRSLGGLRRPAAESPNTGWRNASFRGYADYMQSAEFGDALETLIALAAEQRTAVMCAEAVPWRCHRSLIGDALLVRGIEVVDILGPKQTRPHTLTPFAVVEGTHITYPPPR